MHLSTTPVISDTFSVTIGYFGIIRLCYMLHCAQLSKLGASKAGNKPVPRAASGNSSIFHKHPTGTCPNLVPKMLGNLFSHRADKHQLLTHSEQHPELEHEQGQEGKLPAGVHQTQHGQRGWRGGHPELTLSPVCSSGPHRLRGTWRYLNAFRGRQHSHYAINTSSFCFPSRLFFSITINQT